jgi:putative ABC transport system permease protein
VGISKDDKSGENNTAFSPFTTISSIYNYGQNVDRIEFTFSGVSTQEESDAFEDRYRARINANHDAAPDDESALWIWNRLAQSLQMNTGLGILRTALWVVGLFTLLSGIVGVSNIMLITVKERTREFGIRKALGAGTWSILKMIIVESVSITTFFGYLGMLCGVLANEYMNATIGQEVVDTGIFQATMFLNPTVGLDVCVQATLVMIVAGTVAGLIPALKAARVRPIVALNAK